MTRTTTTRRDAYAEITDRIIAALDSGVAPWRKGYNAGAGKHRNATTDRPYSGINVILLTLTAFERGYGDPRWLTFKQAQAAGGNVRKGERGTQVVYWNRVKVEDKATGEDKMIPLLKVFTVFNVAQVDGLELAPADAAAGNAETVADADAIVARYVEASGVTINFGPVSVPYYSKRTDTINVPAVDAFETTANFYEIVMHEIAHSTGAAERLNRASMIDYVGDHEAPNSRCREELTAEITAAFLMAEAGIVDEAIGNMAAYCKSWAALLREDKRAIIVAAGAAQRAADYVLGGGDDEQDAE
jgi:antirestriction protein ArdC